MNNTNNIDLNLVVNSLNQKLSVANYIAAQWEAKANQLDQENQQLKAELEQLKHENNKKGGK